MIEPNNNSFKLLDTLPIGVCIIDHESTIMAWNEMLYKWTSVAEQYIIGERLTALYPELNTKHFLERLTNLFVDGIPIVFSAAVHRYFIPVQQPEGDKSVLMLQQTVVRLLSNDPPRAMICIEDVSESYLQLSQLRSEVKERKRTEKLLQHRNQTLRKITQLQTNIIKQVIDENFYQQLIEEFIHLFNTKAVMVIKITNPQNPEYLYNCPEKLMADSTEVGIRRNYILRAWYDQVDELTFEDLRNGFQKQTDCVTSFIDQNFYTQDITKGIINHTVEDELEPVSRKFRNHLTLPISNGDEVLALIVISINDLEIDQETIDFLTPVMRTIGQLLRTRRAESQRALAMQELKLNAQRLENAKREAELATQTKSNFLANMSHEIRTPMTAIIGFTDVLLEHDLSEEETKSTIGIIHKNGEHLLSLINDILDLSKIEAGKMSLEKVNFSPIEEAKQVLDLMRSRAEKKKLALEMDVLQPVPAFIKSDPTRFRQVLVNLIGNAIKFTHQGFVRLVINVSYPREIEADPQLKLSIQDTGIGIPHDKLERIFECFSQADSSTTREFGGTGLGLSISRKICQMLGGDLHVVSSPGVGSTFTASIKLDTLTFRNELRDDISLLNKDDHKLTVNHEVNLDKMLLSQLKLLVVDDAVDNRRLIDFILSKIGIKGQFAENGQIALSMVLEAMDSGSGIDVILMDMHMPIMDGLTATEILRREQFVGKIIALTANAMPQDRKKCMESGCDDFLTKPINRKKLEEVLTHHAHKIYGEQQISTSTNGL